MARTLAVDRATRGGKSLGGKSLKSMRKPRPSAKKVGVKGKTKAKKAKGKAKVVPEAPVVPRVRKTSPWVAHRRRASRLRTKQRKDPHRFFHVAGMVRVAQDVGGEEYSCARYSRDFITETLFHVEVVISRVMFSAKRLMLRAGRITLTADDVMDAFVALKENSHYRGFYGMDEGEMINTMNTILAEKEARAARARALRAAALDDAVASDTDSEMESSDDDDDASDSDEVLEDDSDEDPDDLLEDSQEK